MVHCWTCMRLLPNQCICFDDEESKKRRFFETAMREAHLIEAIKFSGFIPKITVGTGSWRRKVTPKITELPTGVRVSVEIKPNPRRDWRKLEIRLHDAEGKPLYRVTALSVGLYGVIGKFDSLNTYWDLQVIATP